jgi:hypothetical protein
MKVTFTLTLMTIFRRKEVVMENLKKLKRSTAKLMVWHGMEMLKNRAPHVLNDIDLETLDLSDGMKCVLGQGFGMYSAGRDALSLDNKTAEKYGLYLDDQRYEDFNRDYSLLTEVWIKELKKYRKLNPVPF